MSAPKVLALAGSLRAGSYNRKLLAVASALARKAGAEVATVDLKELALPVYNGDDEESKGLPESARRLKRMMKASDGFLIASPEYNSSIPGGLKNALDWASRAEEGEGALEAFRGKSAALLSASPGALGGLRGLAALRSMLGNIGVLVIPEQVALSKADEAFNEDGSLKDPKRLAALVAEIQAFVALLRKLA